MIIVSTDGSCLRNPGGAIGWAWVNHADGSGSGGAPTGTNQIAELRALLEAIRAHGGSEPLLIESDSLYAIKCASEWIHGWRGNGWKTSTGGAVKNVELIQQIDRAIAARPGPVRFRWVRGHVGNYFNEQADRLAGQAARQAAAAGVDAAPAEPVREPITAPEADSSALPEKVAAATEKATATAHSVPHTPRRHTAKTAKATAPDALTLF